MALWRADQTSLVVLGPLIGSLLAAGWIIGPIFYGMSDESLDTTKLALFPIDGAQATRGIAVSSLISPGPLTTVAPLAVFVARSPGPLSAIIATAAALGSLLLPVAASKLVLTLLGNASRTSGKRDWATTAAGAGAAALAIGMHAIVAFGPGISIERLTPLASALAWTPLGWAGDALGQASAGALLVPAIKVGVVAGLLLGVLRFWSRALERALTEVTDEQASDLRSSHLLGQSARWNTRYYGPVLAKELRYLRRDPRYRMQIISQLVVLFVGGVPFVQAVINKDPAAVLIGCIPALTTGVTGTNLLGPDGQAFSRDTRARLASAPDPRTFIGVRLDRLHRGVGRHNSDRRPTPEGGSSHQLRSAPQLAWRSSGPASARSVGGLTNALPRIKESEPVRLDQPWPRHPHGTIHDRRRTDRLTGGSTHPDWPRLFPIVDTRLGGDQPHLALYGIAVWRRTTGYAGRRADARAPEIIQVFAAAT
ncbi:MAG: hypothetical protein R2706_01100 [Acidimicrobiales bacterium]